MLNKLMQRAEPGSLPWRFACQELAEQLVEADPWRAALIVRRLLADGESDRAWAVLGLCLALLGHARSSLSAYRRALALAPHCAEYAHNVGHLLDAGLNRPKDALRYLNQAHRSLPSDVEIAASLAHALVRLGREAEARGAARAAALGARGRRAARALDVKRRGIGDPLPFAGRAHGTISRQWSEHEPSPPLP